MIWRALILLCGLAALPGVAAAKVTVVSGEHETFSRLVLTLPAPQDWQLGRTATGYELQLAAGPQVFDVSRVFEMIPKDRLTGIFVDPASGRLQLTVGCSCHAIPFSLDARTLVIDLRDGAAPERSAFEMGLDGVAYAALTPGNRKAPRPRARPGAAAATPVTTPARYNWLDLPQQALPPPALPPLSVPDDASNAIRDAIVAQLAEGAARGVVDLALPQDATDAPAPFLPEAAQVRLTSAPGVQVMTGNKDPSARPLAPDGLVCIPDDRLQLTGWLTDRNPGDRTAALPAALVGEFDRPDPAAVVVAMQTYVALGFGAEARSLAQAFAPEGADVALLVDLALIIDGDPAPATHVFSGMEGCDTAAALWAYLAMPDLTGARTDRAEANLVAIKRSFSALPTHLRTHLGPVLVERLLADDNTALAAEIAGMMRRGGVTDDRSAQLAAADVALATADGAVAETKATTVLADGGPMGPRALVTLVDARMQADAPVDAGLADTIEALMAEHAGLPLEQPLRRAYLRALAGSGQFERLFVAAATADLEDPEIWTTLAATGSDDDVLAHALLPAGVAAAAPAAAAFAQRLTALGFPAQASEWAWIASTQDAVAAPPDTQPDTQPSAAAAEVVAAPAEEGVLAAEAAADSAPPPADEASAPEADESGAAPAQGAEAAPRAQLQALVDEPAQVPLTPSLTAAESALEGSRATRDLIGALLGSASPPSQ
jgi:hypothetical protein